MTLTKVKMLESLVIHQTILTDSGPTTQESSNPQDPDLEEEPTMGGVADWCVGGRCRPMPQEIENKSCKLKKCITLSSRFTKLCLVPDVLEWCIRNTSDIRNDREDNSTRAFRKAAYRQFILACHGHLGKEIDDSVHHVLS